MEQKSEMEKHSVLRMNNEESNKLTKECLSKALIYLMNEKPFDSITISELVKRAGVSRTAFYRNYSVKEDIIHEIAQDAIKLISSLIEKSSATDKPEKQYLEFFELAKNHGDILKLLSRSEFSLSVLFENGSIIDNLYPSNTPLEHYRRLAAEAAFYKILRVWADTGMQETPAEMAKICSDIIGGKKEILLT